MEPRLIFKDQQGAEKQITLFAAIFPKIKQVYDQVIALDADFSLDVAALRNIIMDRVSYRDVSNALAEYVESAIIEKVGEPDFNGVKIAKDKLRNLLSFPSYEHILSYIDRELSGADRVALDAIFGYLAVNNDNIALKAGFEQDVHKSYEIYTRTDKGAMMMERLESLIPALNDYNGVFNANGSEQLNYAFGRSDVNLLGVKFSRSEYILDHEAVIRHDN